MSMAVSNTGLAEHLRSIGSLLNRPLLNRRNLESTFKAPPKTWSEMPSYYLQHLKNVFSDPAKLKMALTDVTPLSALGLMTTIPTVMAASRVAPHRRAEHISGAVGNLLGGQLMQRTGLVGGVMGSLVGEMLGRSLGSAATPAMRRKTLPIQIAEALAMGGESKLGAEKSSVWYHGSPHKLTTLRAGSYVTDDLQKARMWGVPWGSDDVDNDPLVDNHFQFKAGRRPDAVPLYVYKFTAPAGTVLPSTTNKGGDYPGVFTAQHETPVHLVESHKNWKDTIPFETAGESKVGASSDAMNDIYLPNATVTDENIGGSMPSLQDRPEQQYHGLNVANRGDTRAEDYPLIRLLNSLVGGMGGTEKGPGTEMQGTSEEPVGLESGQTGSRAAIGGLPAKPIVDRLHTTGIVQ